MNLLDFVFLLVLFVSLAMAAWKGFAKVLVSLAALVVGLVLAARLYGRAGSMLFSWVHEPVLRVVLGFLAVFFLVLALGALVAFALDRILKWSQLRWVDRILGALFGLLRGWCICTVIVVAMVAFSWKVALVERSELAPYLLMTGRAVSLALPAHLEKSFTDGFRAIYQKWVAGLAGYRIEGGSKPGKSPQKGK